jgi:predicted nucleic acid-binding protein
MALLFWDASALAKRYVTEVGTATVNALFTSTSTHDFATTPWSYAETYSLLLRKLNGGVIDRPMFTTAVTALQAEVVNSPDFRLLSITDATVFASIGIIHQHSLNATDAAILALLLEYTQVLPSGRSGCVVIAADRRLLRAADAEGLKTVDPEALATADVPAFLASLWSYSSHRQPTLSCERRLPTGALARPSLRRYNEAIAHQGHLPSSLLMNTAAFITARAER